MFAVLADHDTERARPVTRRSRTTKQGLVHVSRMTLALRCIRAFWVDQSVVIRPFFLDPVPEDVTLVVDAPPWGTGGILVHSKSWTILAAFTYKVTAEDAQERGVSLGEHTAQAAFELLGVYVALAVYIRFFRLRRRVPRVRGDSSAALGSAQRLSSPSPAMNFLGAEIALMLEREDCAEMIVSHVPGKLNQCADYLSRLMMPLKDQPPKPGSLGESKVKKVLLRRPFALGGFGPGPRPDLWGKAQETTAIDWGGWPSCASAAPSGSRVGAAGEGGFSTREPLPKRPRFQ